MRSFLKIVAVVCLITFHSSVVTGLFCWECENVHSQKDCLALGSLVQCKPTQNTCQITIRHGGWGKKPLIEKSCKQLSACGSNHIQDSGFASVFDEHTQCSMKPPSSVCRCCCSTNGCNVDVLFCKGLEGRLGGLPCPSLRPPRYGAMFCEGGSKPQSECTFNCKRGYKMIGASVSKCNLFSERDYPAPFCRPPRCRKLRKLQYGVATCTKKNAHRSKCSFRCQQGYRLRGAATIVCVEDIRSEIYGTWSRPQPQCRPAECKPQTLSNGEVTCSNERYVGSSCNFKCDSEKGYIIYPPGRVQNTCQPNENWTVPTPCCTLPCPPFAVMDFVVILDSSSSVGAENWVKMKNFVRLFLSDFSVREDATHFAVVRFNKIVDRRTEIKLNDHPNSLEDVLNAFDRIPYSGSGTNTGKAISYVASTLLHIGNRPFARDVVLLITDGASQDDVSFPARALHATGALVFVLPVLPPVGRLDLNEIRIIAKYEENILKDALEGGFDALDEAFAKRMSNLLCREPCGNLSS